jgi:hypothetical protein
MGWRKKALLLLLRRKFYRQLLKCVNWRTRQGQRLEESNLLGHRWCFPTQLSSQLVGVLAAAP